MQSKFLKLKRLKIAQQSSTKSKTNIEKPRFHRHTDEVKKFFYFNFILLTLVWASTSTAWGLTVSAVNKTLDRFSGTVHNLYFSTKAQAADGCLTATGGQKTFPPDSSQTAVTIIDTTSLSAGELLFDITAEKSLTSILNGSTATANSVSIRVQTSGGTALPLVPHGTSYNSASVYQVDYGTADYASVRVGIPLRDLSTANTPADSFTTSGYCALIGPSLGLTSTNFCRPPGGNTPSTVTLQFAVLGRDESIASNSLADSTVNDGDTYNVILADCPTGATTSLGTFSTARYNFSVVPGDQRLKVVNESTPPTADANVPIIGAVIYAEPSSNPNTSSAVRTLVSNTGTYSIEGLANDTQYCVGIGYVNAAGFVTTDASYNPTFGYSKCATPSPIEGFLNRSTCFIASAAYGDEWNPRLEILRQFRDQILLPTRVGKKWVQWYYSWSPEAAHWIYNRPSYRALVQLSLFPLVEAAKLALWMRTKMWLLVLGFILTTVSLVAWQSRKVVSNG